MMLATVPELADGGYWYAVSVVPDPDNGGQTPGDIPGLGWCAWYHEGIAVIRCPDPVASIASASAEQIAAVLSAKGIAGKPHGRVVGS